jgi:hypothetical protein
MKAFHGKKTIKAKYLSRIRAHAAADEIEKGFYWQRGRGCAVGCTIHGSDHAAYETELGIPMWLALLENRIFEGMPLDQAKLWPEKFLAAIAVGQDLEKVKKPFLAFVVADAKESARSATARATSALTEALTATEAASEAAEAAASESAAWEAASAALAAARAAEAATWSAATAARALARAEAEAEADTEANAANAVEALAEAAVWPSLAEAAQAEAYSYFADKLIELIEQAGNTKEEQKS